MCVHIMNFLRSMKRNFNRGKKFMKKDLYEV